MNGWSGLISRMRLVRGGSCPSWRIICSSCGLRSSWSPTRQAGLSVSRPETRTSLTSSCRCVRRVCSRPSSCGRSAASFSSTSAVAGPEVDLALADRDELLVLVGELALQPELVDGVGEEQHLDALAGERLEVGRMAHRVERRSAQVVDVLLAFLHPSDVVGERGRFVAMGGRAQDQVEQAGAVLAVRREPLLEDSAELAPERAHRLRLVLAQLADRLERLPDREVADRPDLPVVLEDLARHVQREVLAVDDPLQEPQPLGQQRLPVVHDVDPLHVELHPLGDALAVIQVERGLRGMNSRMRALNAPSIAAGMVASGSCQSCERWR